MNLELTDEQKMIQEMAQDFAKKEFPALIKKYERPGLTNDEYRALFNILIPKFKEVGFLGVGVPREYGGSGLDTFSSLIIMEELSRFWGSAGLAFAVINSLCGYPLLQFANEKQKQKYLVPLVRGEKIGCYCLTESHGGSAPHLNRVSAESVKDGYIINGEKLFITQANVADFAIVFARDKSIQAETGKEYHQMCAFLVDTDTLGCRIEKIEDKLGLHASPTCLISFTNCKIPRENLLGKAGKGLNIALSTLDSGRLYIAAQALGFARAAHDEALRYSRERKPEGFPITEYQIVKNRLDSAVKKIEKAKKLLHYVARLKDKEETEITTLEDPDEKEKRRYGIKKITGYSSLVKYFATETAIEAALSGIRILGAYGYTTEFPVGRFLLDAIPTVIYEGSNEIQLKIIEREFNIKPEEIDSFVDKLVGEIKK